jgi:transposase
VDGQGRALKLLLSAGNVADIAMAPALVAGLSGSQCGTLVADKGYDSDAWRVLLVEKDIFPCLAINATRKENRSFHRGYCRKRHHVENFFAALKRQRPTRSLRRIGAYFGVNFPQKPNVAMRCSLHIQGNRFCPLAKRGCSNKGT